MSAQVRVRDLAEWLANNLDKTKSVVVSGGIRGEFKELGEAVPVFELGDIYACTVRFIAPKEPPAEMLESTVQEKDPEKKKKKEEDQRKLALPIWVSGWSNILTASTLLTPRADSVRLYDLLQEKRLIRLFCDTNALASGVAEWLVQVLPAGTQLISSAIADKEIMGWADKNKECIHAKTVAQWDIRLRYQLARRLTEFPPRHTVIDRLSPDQNALMLAQGTDRNGEKSSQGDLLFVELARPIIREQPRQARVVFLTGDTNVARVATSALGPEHVLYANPQKAEAQEAFGKVLARGFWHPGRPYGSLSLPSTSRLLWNALSAFTFLTLTQAGRTWVIESVYSVRYGGPSDWADPWVNIRELPQASSPQTAPNVQPVTPTSVEEPLVHHASTRQTLDVPTKPTIALVNHSEAPIADSPPRIDQWLLPPPSHDTAYIKQTSPIKQSLRLTSPGFFRDMSAACFGKGAEQPTDEVEKESFRILVGLGVITKEGAHGDQADAFRDAWQRNDRDWIHAKLLDAHPGYNAVVEKVRDGKVDELSAREKNNLVFMRLLGQAANLPKKTSPTRIGDEPVSLLELDKALNVWMPHADASIAVKDACERAMSELSLTPARFEMALERLWKVEPQHAIEGRSGGESPALYAESIVELNPDGTWTQREVSPGVLMFGAKSPILYLWRRG